LVVDNDVTYPVQINGKKRGDLTIARDADQGEVERARSDSTLSEGVGRQLPRKVIVVPQRIVNVVA
jgi:leucyl-tRNA synthetase